MTKFRTTITLNEMKKISQLYRPVLIMIINYRFVNGKRYREMIFNLFCPKCKSWTCMTYGFNPIFIVSHPISAILVDCLSLFSSTHPNEVNSTMRSVARHLQHNPPHTSKSCRQSLREPLLRTTERREGKERLFQTQEEGREEVETHRCRNDAWKFCQKVKRLTESC